ncbi:hypothetical protein LSTR_LSTR004757 [Laodelphax striatellus]|uniref:Uncharacterized protein n=1 Tax=Laodelphax striatellus TaxID=195883 RepID=A0A482XK38_LAOST|nr:hypothetical protein LSTR_LSTR004757 [Laodelphax striatellus]
MTQPEKLVEHQLKKSIILKKKYSTSNRIIQSRLINHSLEVASQKELNLNLFKQKNVFKMCQWCFCYWANGLYSFKILPQKRTSKFIRSLSNKDTESLTELQLKQKNKYTERRNIMVLKCHACNKETKVPLQKPDPIAKKIQSSDQNHSLLKKSKKKKKKKDFYAGLKSEAIMKCKTSSADEKSTLLLEDTNLDKASNNMASSTTYPNSSTSSKKTNSILNIQKNTSKKKKNKLNIGKLKLILEKEKNSNVSTISKKKKNSSLLSTFLTSL